MLNINYFILNILIYCLPIFGAIFIIVGLISKSILQENGYKVTYLTMSFSDITNMKKLSTVKADLRVVYYSLLISTVAFLSLFAMSFFIVVSETLSRI
ncbi:MAG: hypothetical protein COW63_03385 [Bacteroidetes bacterium CG18_big_fil_WC_8_21_14_2_50_41_14]|nr:MAG: hypothetical protein COW63_03385 [Bacteroidetes bacterium CG18_big_fil_WC_8_21_14_2_50_41_14]PJB57731.1 MAG: hypothetical protein CO098_10870 [Bacteroidetes bacterium CG_4_9_14_3_um_filter_41_19]